MTKATFSIRTARGGHRVVITANGNRVETPPVEHLTYYATLGVLAAAEIIDWPVALVLTAGHVLANLTNRPALNELGEAVEAT